MVHIVVKSGNVFGDSGDGWAVAAAFSNPEAAKTFAEGLARELWGTHYRPIGDLPGFEHVDGDGNVRIISQHVVTPEPVKRAKKAA